MAKKNSPSRKSRKGRGGYERWLVIGIIVSLLIVALTLWGPFRKFRYVEHARPLKTGKQEQIAKKPEGTSLAPAPSKPKEKTSLIAIVIDDLGQDMKPARELLALHAQITFAVMPGLQQSRKIAEIAKQSDREVLLHMPMERKNHKEKPQARGTLRSDMTPMEFMNTINENIESVPGAAGVNNHEGSALTENREAMKFLMAELKARELSFLDSLTDPKSAAYSVAREFGIKAAKRDVFLDNENDNPGYIRGQIRELERIAKKRGSAIGIGHPHPATISEIKKWLSEIDEQKIEIVPVSRLMK